MDRDEEARRTREARETMVATALGLSTLAQDAALARVPIYGFSIAGLMADGDVRNSSMLPTELRTPIFNARSATAGNDGLRILAAASGGRAIVDDNEPVRFVPAIFDENSAYYLIGYKATYGLTDGHSHRLKIRVNRPGVTVFPADRLSAVEEAHARQERRGGAATVAARDLRTGTHVGSSARGCGRAVRLPAGPGSKGADHRSARGASRHTAGAR